MERLWLSAVAVVAAFVVLATGIVFAGPASAAAVRDGKCDSGEFCYYYNSNEAGSISDFTDSLDDYGTTKPSCYVFKGAGNGQDQCIKNHAASVWNRSSKTVRVYFNSNYAGSYQDFAAGAKGNLNSTLKNQDASHQFLSGGSTSCSTSGLGDPNTCAEAVNWATSHETTSYHSDYDGRCDHVVALAYGFSNSGSTSAHSHWLAIPSTYKHPGATTVPTGGLAFFSGGSSGFGHVMISIGGGKFVSNDIGGRGYLTETTISTITSTWHETYDGWAQPWFQVNH